MTHAPARLAHPWTQGCESGAGRFLESQPAAGAYQLQLRGWRLWRGGPGALPNLFQMWPQLPARQALPGALGK